MRLLTTIPQRAPYKMTFLTFMSRLCLWYRGLSIENVYTGAYYNKTMPLGCDTGWACVSMLVRGSPGTSREIQANPVSQPSDMVFEHTCAYARWAVRHHFLSDCPSVCLWLDQNSDWTKIQDWTKIHLLDQNSDWTKIHCPRFTER